MAKKQKSTATLLDRHPEIKGFLLLLFSLLLLLSLLSFAYGKSWLGLVGLSLGWLTHKTFGIASYLIAFYLGWLGWRITFSKNISRLYLKNFFLVVGVISLCFLLSLVEEYSPATKQLLSSIFYPAVKTRPSLGGVPFSFLYCDLPGCNLRSTLNAGGVLLIFSLTFATSVLFFGKRAFLQGVEKMRFWFLPPVDAPPEEEPQQDFMRYVKLRTTATPTQEVLGIQPEMNLKERPSLSRKNIPEAPEVKMAPKKEKAVRTQRMAQGDFQGYQLPPITLLSNARKVDHAGLKRDLRKQAEVLEETLFSFGIEAKVGQINCGPTITSFEVHPSIGVKVQKIKSLEHDIALNLEAKSIRIIAPIPGKAAVGIEIPNPQPQEVGFKEMLAAYQQGTQKFRIPVLLGKTVHGDYVMQDLTKMPHCIIAGATGSGKSVCINTIVMTILMTSKPDEIRIVMVDPKKVELTPYTHLPHMISPVITEPRGACAALNWLVKEMEGRYELLKRAGVRNIEAFNTRTTTDKELPAKLPYMVGIIDELADLMMVSSHDVEAPIARIAQMARAVGIHLILATQRPSREVITGLIKANFPTRISFKVASRVNSLIILDEIGAESLLGNGDMLFLPPGTSHLTRAQGALIRDEDIHAVVQFICNQAPPNYLIPSFDALASDDLQQDDGDTETDALYNQAKDLVTKSGVASATFLQRKLKIGYARAASLLDELQDNGIIGVSESGKPRKLLTAKKEEPLP